MQIQFLSRHSFKTRVTLSTIGHIFGQPVGHDASGRVTGALTGLTNLTQPNFLRIITDNAYGKTDGFLLVDPVARRAIVATDQARILEQFPPPRVNPALDRFLAGYEGSQIMVNPRGVEILASDKGAPTTGWIAAAVLPTADAFAAIDATQQRMLQATVLLTLLAGGLTWWQLRRNLAPVSDTVRALTALGHSVQPLQAVPVRSTGELGQLVSAFNPLLSRLAQHEQASRQSRTMLARTEAIAPEFDS